MKKDRRSEYLEIPPWLMDRNRKSWDEEKRMNWRENEWVQVTIASLICIAIVASACALVSWSKHTYDECRASGHTRSYCVRVLL